MNEDKRLYPRLAFDCPAQCSLVDEFPDSFPVIIIDIGPEGLGFVSDQGLRIGESIIIIVDLGAGGPVKFIAKVRWSGSVPNSTQYKIGVKITDASSEDLEKFIRFYCRQLIPGQERKKSILIIEKDRDIAGSLKSELDKYRYEVVCASNGEEGFARYVSGRPDLIVLDFAIPKLNGLEICRKIRKLQNDDRVRIYMLIGKKKEREKFEAQRIGIQKYFQKPINIDTVVEAIHQALIMTD